jgi:hypothetical protein
MANQYAFGSMSQSYDQSCVFPSNRTANEIRSPSNFMDRYEYHRANVQNDPDAFVRDIRFIMNVLG